MLESIIRKEIVAVREKLIEAAYNGNQSRECSLGFDLEKLEGFLKQAGLKVEPFSGKYVEEQKRYWA